jgi:hypothetical protein
MNGYLFLKVLLPMVRLNLLKLGFNLWFFYDSIKRYKSHSLVIMFLTIIPIEILKPISITTKQYNNLCDGKPNLMILN